MRISHLPDALYHIVERELRKISRPMASVCGHRKNGSDKDAYWHTFEAGHATETINRSREQVLYVLDNKYCVRDHSEALASLKPLYKELYGDILTEETQPNGRGRRFRRVRGRLSRGQ